MPSKDEIKKQNQKTIILLLLAFIAPAMIAWLQFEFEIFSSGTKNHGEFITPPVLLEELKLKTQDEKSFGIEQLKGNWHLVYIVNGNCSTGCIDRLSVMHQSRLAQGKAMSRVRLIYIATDKDSFLQGEKLKKDYARLTVLTGDENAINKAIKLFTIDANQNIMEDNMIFMIDPLGNLMMRYKADVRLIGIIKDLEHLLKVSQIG